MALFEYLYTLALIVFSVPIVLSFILRKIAGKHAPADYEPESPSQVLDRKIKERKESDAYWDDIWNPLNARINGFEN